MSRFDTKKFPAEVVDAAKLHILDSLGCLLAGSRLEAGRLAYELAVATSGANVNSHRLSDPIGAFLIWMRCKRCPLQRTAARWTISTAVPELVSAP